jgi:hypothetical protein
MMILTGIWPGPGRGTAPSGLSPTGRPRGPVVSAGQVSRVWTEAMDLPRVGRVTMILAAPPVPTLGPSGIPMLGRVAARKDRVEVLLPPAKK